MGSIEGEQPTEQKPTPFNLTDVDRQVLSQTDEEFVFHDWEDLKGIIGKFHSHKTVTTDRLFSCSPHLNPSLPKYSTLNYSVIPTK